MDSPLIIKSKQFALDVIKVCNSVKNCKEKSREIVVLLLKTEYRTYSVF